MSASSVFTETLCAVCPAGGRGLCIQSYWESRTRLHLCRPGQSNHPPAGRNRRQHRGKAGFTLHPTFSLCRLVPSHSTGQAGEPEHFASAEQAAQLLQSCEQCREQEEPLWGLCPRHAEAEPAEGQRGSRAQQRGARWEGEHTPTAWAGAGQGELIRAWGAWGETGQLIQAQVTVIKSTL